jgi:chemotaxis protein CheD
MSDTLVILPDLNLQPGELYLAQRPAILRTILGSCVGFTFWCARLGAGALCHGVLPKCPDELLATEGLAEKSRFVDFSIRHLAGRFDSLGACRAEVQVKVFGGADVLPLGLNNRNRASIGAQNCKAALEVLAAEGFRVAGSDLGGDRGRRIHFHTGTGEVLLHRLAAWKNAKQGNMR